MSRGLGGAIVGGKLESKLPALYRQDEVKYKMLKHHSSLRAKNWRGLVRTRRPDSSSASIERRRLGRQCGCTLGLRIPGYRHGL